VNPGVGNFQFPQLGKFGFPLTRKERAMSKWMRPTILAAGVAVILGCPQQPPGTAAMVEDKTYGDPAVEGDPYTEEGGEG
jgi:hypothetical protein